jgi:hypothetical protein
MANLLQTSQQKSTCVPSFYTNYLTNLATKGTQAACGAGYVGAQPLQTQAFCEAAANFGKNQAGITAGQNLVGQAAQQNITGASAPYLQAGTSANPLNAMTPYAQNAMCTTGYEAGMPLINKGSGLSGLSAANPFLGKAAGVCGACVSGQYVNQATKLNMAGAAQPYLQQAATSSGLSAAQPYLQQATNTSPANLAASYMNPYLKTAVQSLSDIGQRNIQQNLAPMANAAAVGSGQFGSQRGAQVKGQVQANAMQDLNSQIAQMMSQGYGQALCAAGKQNALTASAGQTAGNLAQQQAGLLGQLGSTAGSLTGQQQQNLINAGNVQGTLAQQQANLLGQLGSTAGSLTNQTAQNLINAGSNLGNLQQGANQISAGLGSTAANAQAQQNQANLTAAQTAAQSAANQGNLLNQAGQNMGALGVQGANMNLACINALSTLGAQQQAIGQNAQCYNLSKYAKLAGIMQGAQIPTTVKTTMCESPYSAMGALGASALGAYQKCPNIFNKIGTSLGGLLPSFGGSSTPNTSDGAGIGAANSGSDFGGNTSMPAPQPDVNTPIPSSCFCFAARGGLIRHRGAIGCSSTRHYGGLTRG